MIARYLNMFALPKKKRKKNYNGKEPDTRVTHVYTLYDAFDISTLSICRARIDEAFVSYILAITDPITSSFPWSWYQWQASRIIAGNRKYRGHDRFRAPMIMRGGLANFQGDIYHSDFFMRLIAVDTLLTHNAHTISNVVTLANLMQVNHVESGRKKMSIFCALN